MRRRTPGRWFVIVLAAIAIIGAGLFALAFWIDGRPITRADIAETSGILVLCGLVYWFGKSCEEDGRRQARNRHRWP